MRSICKTLFSNVIVFVCNYYIQHLQTFGPLLNRMNAMTNSFVLDQSAECNPWSWTLKPIMDFYCLFWWTFFIWICVQEYVTQFKLGIQSAINAYCQNKFATSNSIHLLYDKLLTQLWMKNGRNIIYAPGSIFKCLVCICWCTCHISFCS